MKKLCVVLAAGSVVLAGAASAADMPARTYTKAPVPATVVKWTGFYVGGQAGYGWSSSTDRWSPNDPTSTLLFNGLGGLPGEQPQAGVYNVRRQGAIGGVEAGYNWQVDPRWVFGVEADFSVTGMKGSGSGVSIFGVGFAGGNWLDSLTSTQRTNWYGTVRGRMGWLATPDLLLFGTGGLAYGNTSQSANESTAFANGAPGGPFAFNPGNGFSFICPSGVQCFTESSSTTSIGWTAGAGAEWMFQQNWTAKIEYQFVDLGSQTLRVTAVTSVPGTTPSSYNVSFRNQFSVVRVGLNYKFGGPVIARY